MKKQSSFIAMRDKERQDRKALILSSAMTLCREKGPWHISMRNIAKHLGISPSSIYRYFPCKEDLFVDILISNAQKIKNQLFSGPQEKEGSIEKIVAQTMDFFLENELYFQILAYFMIQGIQNPRVEEKFLSFRSGLRDAFRQAVSDAMGEKEIQDMQMNAFLSSITGVVLTLKNHPGLQEHEKRCHMHELTMKLINGSRHEIVAQPA